MWSRPTGSFSVGAGFSNLENFVFTANVQKNNFLGLRNGCRGQRRWRQQGNFQIFDPYFLDTRFSCEWMPTASAVSSSRTSTNAAIPPLVATSTPRMTFASRSSTPSRTPD